MRASILVSLGVAVGVTLGAAPAEARDYPWCLEESSRGGFVTNCGYTSFAQCLASRSTPSGGNCYRNPAFRGFAEDRRERPRRERNRP